MGKRAKRKKKKTSSQSGNNAHQNAGQPNKNATAPGTNKDDKNHALSADDKSVGIMVVEALGIGICGVLSNNFFSTGHKILGVSFSFGAVGSFLALLSTAIARKHSKWKTWTGFGVIVTAVAGVFIFWAINLSKPDLGPSMADIGQGITNLESMVSGGNSNANAMATYFSNQWQQSQQQLNNEQIAVDEVRAANAPRTITPEQREKIIKILREHNNVSKVPIKVIVGNSDSETENFAMQVRELLDAAGYGEDAKPMTDEEYNPNRLEMTGFEPDVPVPPFDSSGKFQEIISIPGVFPSPITNGQKDVAVIAVFASTNGQISIPAPNAGPDANSIMVFYPNPKVIHNTNDIHYAYHSTKNPDDILSGVSSVFINGGISVGPMQGKAFLPPGQIGFFIPQKIY